MCVGRLVSAFRLCFVCARERIFSIYERVQRARSGVMMTTEVGGTKAATGRAHTSQCTCVQ